jgi:hypothetical protein
MAEDLVDVALELPQALAEKAVRMKYSGEGEIRLLDPCLVDILGYTQDSIGTLRVSPQRDRDPAEARGLNHRALAVALQQGRLPLGMPNQMLRSPGK